MKQIIDNFVFQNSPKLTNSWAMEKQHFVSKNHFGYFFGQLLEKFGYFYSNIWSHCLLVILRLVAT